MNNAIAIVFVVFGALFVCIGVNTLSKPKRKTEVAAKIESTPFKEAPQIAIIYLRSWWKDERTICRNYWFCVVNNVPEFEPGRVERPSIITGYFESPEAWRASNDAAWLAKSNPTSP